MARSLNPRAAGQPSSANPAPASTPQTPRRNVLVAAMAATIGAVVSLVPLGLGLAVFFDPLLRRKTSAKTSADKGQLRRVATFDSLPPDGTPMQVPVIADQTDAWNREPNQPIGAVYLRRLGSQVKCFNSICPHAGCFIAFAAEREVFQCPCHASSFQLDGSCIKPSPSPRDMDELKVDPDRLKNGEVWIEFVNYYPGKEHQEPKP